MVTRLLDVREFGVGAVLGNPKDDVGVHGVSPAVVEQGAAPSSEGATLDSEPA